MPYTPLPPQKIDYHRLAYVNNFDALAIFGNFDFSEADFIALRDGKANLQANCSFSFVQLVSALERASMAQGAELCLSDKNEQAHV